MRRYVFLGILVIAALIIAGCNLQASVCGDGFCSIDEKAMDNCPQDCETPPPTCDDSSIRDSLRDGETKTYTSNGKDYEITAVFIDSTFQTAKVSVNGVLTKELNVGKGQKLGDGQSLITILEIMANQREGLVEFCFKSMMAAKTTCGDGVVEEGEQCDGSVIGKACQDISSDFSGGTLRCTEDCRYSTSGCVLAGVDCTSDANCRELACIGGGSVHEVCISGKCVLQSQCAVKPECQMLWWFDSTTTTCAKKQFCGTYMYNGLRTFNTEAECGAALTHAPFCGDGNVAIGNEQCEPKSTSNSQNCPQAVENCDGNKLQTRPDAFGNCDSSCNCVSDPFGAAICVKGKCGAACAATSDCLQSTENCVGNKLQARDSQGSCSSSCQCILGSWSTAQCVKNKCGAACIADSDCGNGFKCDSATCQCVATCYDSDNGLTLSTKGTACFGNDCKEDRCHPNYYAGIYEQLCVNGRLYEQYAGCTSPRPYCHDGACVAALPTCGDGKIDADLGEECEYPNTQDSSYCGGSESCSGAKLRISTEGSCNSECKCQYDIWSNAICAKGKCGATCSSNSDCTNGATCSPTTCTCIGGSVCGDGTCGAGETTTSCPGDCASTMVCSDPDVGMQDEIFSPSTCCLGDSSNYCRTSIADTCQIGDQYTVVERYCSTPSGPILSRYEPCPAGFMCQNGACTNAYPFV